MPRSPRKAGAMVAVLAVTVLVSLFAVHGCGDSYKSAVGDIIADLQVVQNEVLGETEQDASSEKTDAVSRQQRYIDGLESLREDVGKIDTSVLAAQDDLEVLIPPDASSLAFHEDYLASLGEYSDALNDYAQVLEYQMDTVAVLMEILPDTSATEGVWAELGGLRQAGVDAANLGRLVSSATEAEALLADGVAKWHDAVPPIGGLAEAHRALADDLESLRSEFERLSVAASSAADSGSADGLSELNVLCAFALDQVDFLSETVDAWWVEADAAYLDGAFGLADLQDEVDAVEATVEDL